MKQKNLWNKVYKKRKSKVSLGEPSSFAKEIPDLLTSNSKLLDLGCGMGSDSAFFAHKGLEVVATDFSEVILEKNKENFKNIPNLSFMIQDTSKPLKFSDEEFDVVFAHLPLHYFTGEVTKKVFQEIYRVLKPNGLFCFACKSTKDYNFGLGKKLEENMFDKDGHIRHFFDEAYATELLSGNYKAKVWLKEEEYEGKATSITRVVAQKVK